MPMVQDGFLQQVLILHQWVDLQQIATVLEQLTTAAVASVAISFQDLQRIATVLEQLTTAAVASLAQALIQDLQRIAIVLEISGKTAVASLAQAVQELQRIATVLEPLVQLAAAGSLTQVLTYHHNLKIMATVLDGMMHLQMAS